MEMPVPSQSVLARKSRVVERLQGVLPMDAVIHDEMETRSLSAHGGSVAHHNQRGLWRLAYLP